ncbi:nucleotide sugar dehydrogenase [Kocuria sp. M1R5S2]|uniref:nucleotide sugar dehydrogenase n=1 Tax=Kocuria rhizosphaerae TaxID=3376285 RepID=UPI00378D291C
MKEGTGPMTKLAVIGQGYVGLPLSEAAADNGFEVVGVDAHPGLVDQLNDGRSHVDDLNDADIERMLEQGYRATTDYGEVADADYVVICVPTPLSDDGGPDLSAVKSATRSVAGVLRAGTTVVLESTTYPGTTEEVVLPILQESGLEYGQDFFLAFSPERINPGFPEFGIRNTPKLVGGVTMECTEKATAMYRRFVDEVVPLKGAREAETAKLLENTYRHVNIALVNEMARFCHDMDIDIWEAIRGAATKPFGFQKFTPGPGVGGHCIPIDPNYLSHHVKRTLGYPFRFVELAQEINEKMPQYVVQRGADLLNDAEKSVKGSDVLLLGVTYKPNIADQRESPAIPVANGFLSRGANVSFYDPFVETWRLPSGDLPRVPDLEAAVRAADLVVLLQDHRSFGSDDLAGSSAAFLDTRGVTDTGRATRL